MGRRGLPASGLAAQARPVWRRQRQLSKAAMVARQRLISQGTAMSENPESSNERPCLHCLIGDLIDEYYAEYGTATGETDVIDIDETISALAKTIADLTYGSDVAARQRVKDDLIRDITEFEAEYEKEPSPGLRH
jgi:hypothetical protein